MRSSLLTLVVLAAGRSRRYGRPKQLDPIGPGDATLMEYGIFDALEVGFERFVVVIHPEDDARFRDVLARVRSAGVDIHLVHQVDGLPMDRYEGPERRRPWGTGFALLAAADHVEGSFAVGNADDFYGLAAFSALGAALPAGPNAWLITYALEDTLSPAGGVSRGLCDVDPGTGLLLGIREGLNLERDPGADLVRGEDARGGPLRLPGGTPASMNLWGFHPDVWPLLARDFERFLAGGPGPEDEFYLSEAVGRWLDAGELRCHALAGGEGWLGVTFPEDRPRVARALTVLVDAGIYPRDLWSPLDKGTT